MELITFNCSACQQVLKVSADNAGKKAQCPRCGAAMIIPHASTSEAEGGPVESPPARPAREEERYDEVEQRRQQSRYDDDYDDRRDRRREEDYDDRPRRYERDRYDDDYGRGPPAGLGARKKWWFVRLGILLVAVSASVLAGGALLVAVGEMIRFVKILSVPFDQTTPTNFEEAIQRRAAQEYILGGFGNDAAKVLGRIGDGLLFAGGIAAVVGYVFCVLVPNRKGTLALAIVALSLGAVNLIFNLLTKIIPMMRDSMAGGKELILPGLAFMSDSLGGAYALSLMVALPYFAEIILFAIFLWAVGRSVRSRWLSGTSMGIMIFACVVAGLQIVSMTMTFIAYNRPEAVLEFLIQGKPLSKGMLIVSSVIHLLAMLAFVGLLIWYTLFLFAARSEVRE
jgi:hypothetical protein